MEDVIDPLEKARRVLKMSVSDLWWRYFAIGGMSSELELEAILYQALVPATMIATWSLSLSTNGSANWAVTIRSPTPTTEHTAALEKTEPSPPCHLVLGLHGPALGWRRHSRRCLRGRVALGVFQAAFPGVFE